MSNLKNTIYHYRRKLPWKARSFNSKLLTLPDYFKDLIGDKLEVNIAEVGSGMFCSIGSLWEGVKVNMYASDILSDEFNAILNEAHVVPLVYVTKEDMENLSYKDNFFDIVHCVNALDHTDSPLKAIQEMYRVCKPGGFIYLRHFPNVAVLEKYRGAHQWNIERCEEGIRLWSKREEVLLSDYFSFDSYIGIDDMVTIVIQKE